MSSKENSVTLSSTDSISVISGLSSLYLLFLTIFLVNNFGYEATYFGNMEVRKTLTSTNLVVNNSFGLPVDKSGSVATPTTGMIEYDTTSESLLAYNGTEWKEVSPPSIHAETVESLVTSVNIPVLGSVFDSSYSGTVRNVSDQTTLVNALTAAVDNDVINFTATITLTATLTIPDKRLKFELGSFALQGPTSINTLVSYASSTKELLFSNGTIQHSSGITSSVSVLVSGNAGAKLFFIGTTLVYGEFAISITNGANPSLVPRLFMDSCTVTYDGAVGGAGNSHRAISVNGLSDGSYVYLTTTIFNSVNADDTHRLRLIQTSGTTNAGDITITNCNINPANRLQAVVFYEASLPQTRGTHKLMMDKNIIGNAGERNQLCLLFAGGSQTQILNSFEAVWFVENIIQRQDDDKGLFYIDTSSAGASYSGSAGSTDVYTVKNTYPTLAAPGSSRRLISKDGFVRGSVAITSAYLQRYRL